MTTLDPTRHAEILASFARQGFLAGMDTAITHLAPGQCTLAMPFAPTVAQQHGFFHGGAIGALADVAGGYAAATLLPAGGDVLTLEYKINFLRPAVGDTLVAEGHVLRAGRSVTVTRVDVFVEKNGTRTMCAAMQQSVMRTNGA